MIYQKKKKKKKTAGGVREALLGMNLSMPKIFFMTAQRDCSASLLYSCLKEAKLHIISMAVSIIIMKLNHLIIVKIYSL